jgi:hypothetical protein
MICHSLSNTNKNTTVIQITKGYNLNKAQNKIFYISIASSRGRRDSLVFPSWATRAPAGAVARLWANRVSIISGAHLDAGSPNSRVFKPPRGFLHCTCHPRPPPERESPWGKNYRLPFGKHGVQIPDGQKYSQKSEKHTEFRNDVFSGWLLVPQTNLVQMHNYKVCIAFQIMEVRQDM